MKKIALNLSIVVLLLTGASCNKKLKKEIEELDNSVSELKDKNATLEGQLTNTQNTLNNIDAALETNNPITWTFNGSYNGTNTINGTYMDKLLIDSKADVQYISSPSGNIRNIYIEKAEDFDWENYAYIDINVDVTTNTLISGDIWGETYVQEGGGSDLYGYAYTGNSPNYTLTANSINVNTSTGEVDLDLNWSNSAGYTFGYGTESGTIKFKGTCFIYN